MNPELNREYPDPGEESIKKLVVNVRGSTEHVILFPI
jgi:hypothetical protein